jgi:hypothetical protein
MKKVTFEQFQATKTIHTKETYMKAYPNYDEEMLSEFATEIVTYIDGLFITRIDDGFYQLNIENCGTESEKLEEMEIELYLWANGQFFNADKESLKQIALKNNDGIIELPSGKGFAYNIQTEYHNEFYINGTSLVNLTESQIKKLSKADRQLIYNTYKIDFFNV